MIPKPWEFALLALAVFRLTRLAGWDTFPPIERARAALLRPWIEPLCARCGVERADYDQRGDRQWAGLETCPNCASAEPAIFVEGYGRRFLGELFECPFCLGWWIALALYLIWVEAPTAVLAISTPLALGAVVGLIAKNLDA